MNKPRANEIDLLRFIAALSVVLYHYAFLGYIGQASPIRYPMLEPFAKYGHFGVELFFLISGFVILMSASHGSLKQFVISRVARLYPAFWICCTITFLVVLFFGSDRAPVTFAQYLSNMTMLSSFGFMQRIAAVPYIDGSYWSLAVEMRFYAFVVLILLLRQIHRAEIFLGIWLLSTIGVEVFGVGRLRGFLIVDYSSYFIAGAMLFQIWAHGFSVWRVVALLTCWVLALYQAFVTIPNFEATFHTDVNPVHVLSILSASFLCMTLIAVRKTGLIGRLNWMAIGALTYPLYLVHQVVGYVIINWAFPHVNSHVILLGTLGLMLMISHFVNNKIENRYGPVLKSCLGRCWDASRGAILRARAKQTG